MKARKASFCRVYANEKDRPTGGAEGLLKDSSCFTMNILVGYMLTRGFYEEFFGRFFREEMLSSTPLRCRKDSPFATGCQGNNFLNGTTIYLDAPSSKTTSYPKTIGAQFLDAAPLYRAGML